MHFYNRYKYTLYGKERHLDTYAHPISIHRTKLGAYISLLYHLREYTKMYVA